MKTQQEKKKKSAIIYLWRHVLKGVVIWALLIGGRGCEDFLCTCQMKQGEFLRSRDKHDGLDSVKCMAKVKMNEAI